MAMLLISGLCIFMTISCVLSSVSSPIHPDTEVLSNNKQSYISGYSDNSRIKRSFFGIGKGFFAGIKATDKLLQDAIPILSTFANRRTFVKQGDYSTAKEDFFSVNPSLVRHYQLPGGVEGIIGTVGDRTLMVESRNDPWKGTLKVIKGLGTGKEHMKVIEYEDLFDRFKKN